MRLSVGLAVAFWCLMVLPSHASPATEENARFFPKDEAQQSVPSIRCAEGKETVLEMGGLSRSMIHDGNDGEAHFVLRNKQTGEVLWKDELIGEGVCFGFHARSQRYVIGSTSQHGASLMLRRVHYVSEQAALSRKGEILLSSAFLRGRAEAYATTVSADVGHIAVIGHRDQSLGLFLLDVENDRMRRLGRAPLPAPLEQDEWQYYNQEDGFWGWSVEPRAHYTTIESNIVWFTADALHVSYGNDSPKARAKKRTQKHWKLGKTKLPQSCVAKNGRSRCVQDESLNPSAF